VILTEPDLRVLRVIEWESDPRDPDSWPTKAELASRLWLSPSAVERAVARLLDLGYLGRGDEAS
jgi:hypothetical protein